MKLRLFVLILCAISYSSCFVYASGGNLSEIKIDDKLIIYHNKEYIAKSNDSGLVFFPINQAVKLIKSMVGIREDESKDNERNEDKKNILLKNTKEDILHNDVKTGSTLTGSLQVQQITKKDYLIFQRAIANHKKALELIANITKNVKDKKSTQTIELLYKQTMETVKTLEQEMKKTSPSKTEIKKTVSEIQKQIKQMQSELKKLSK